VKIFAMKARASAFGILCLIVLGGGSPREVSTTDFDHLLQSRGVPGAAFAIVRDGEVVQSGGIGVRDTSTGEPVDERTVFEAASLSKPVFAFAVLQLVDAKILSLDTPLARYAPGFVKGDQRAGSITVRDVLSHSSGLPNWRGWITPLKTSFEPGSQFSYSGEGFIWLQRAVTAATGEDFNTVMARLVFEPLGMRDSSFVWARGFHRTLRCPSPRSEIES
jgi:CubicO group peptidase (beta-lactamase class C family)